ncbi:sulfate transporter [Streptomyces hoynatensis]|uniref:sulfate transporter n=1 Tax=Streptomyces hoynatensis TaxID=1141874 RepID=UPI000EA853D6|nr:sulfate transporter [Streptomyces hoynatensis]
MGAVEFVVRGPVRLGDVPGVCARFAGAVRRSGAARAVVDLAALDGAGPAAIETVARLRLTATRLRCALAYRNVGEELYGLLAALGLAELLGGCGLGEVAGQAEQREEAGGVEEGVDPGDAAA